MSIPKHDLKVFGTARLDELLEGRSLSEVLSDAYALIEEPSRFVQGAAACDARGQVVKPKDPLAVAWSLDGAVARYCNSIGLVPIELLQYLDDCVTKFCTVHPGLQVLLNTEATYAPLSYFTDRAHHDVVLTFLWSVVEDLRRRGS